MTDFSYQLFSSRKFPPLNDTLKSLAEIGYAQVEGFGGLYPDLASAQALRAAIDEAGLAMPTGHVGWAEVEGDPDGTIEIAKTLGLHTVVVPFLTPDDRPNDAAGWAAKGEALAKIAAPIKAAGLGVGWHNHAFEFEKLPTGEFPQDLLLAADADLTLELDLGWVERAGEDPMAAIAKYEDRLVSVHLKDVAPEGQNADEDGWADVGQGRMDYASLLAAAQDTAARVFIVEHDNPSDDRRFALRSLASLHSYGG